MLHFHTVGRVCAGRNNAKAGNRGYAGQGLAPEAIRTDALQIVHAGDLAGGMARDGKLQLFGGDAAAVVLHADQALAAVVQAHVHASSVGVQTVFHQLLEYAGRAFHHFTGRDLIAQLRR